MSEPVPTTKSALRQAMRGELQALSREQKTSAARHIRAKLVDLPVWISAKSVLLFAPRQDEPDIWPLAELGLQAGKRIALPRFVSESGSYEAAVICHPGNDVQAGRYGILEPSAFCSVADPKRLDLVLVPGLAFDWHGHRLGRGKGFYDRLLATVSGKTCGVAFDIQLTSALPIEPHDVRLNCILTPSHWLEF
jgi:5-formyltetrahydrofolate cyclo-ligase